MPDPNRQNSEATVGVEVPERRGLRRPDYMVDEASGCWVWQKSTCPHGYPRISGKPPRRGHRVYLEAKIGPIPSNMHVHHRCENKLCVNPDHLEPLDFHAHLSLHGKSRHIGIAFSAPKGKWIVRVKRDGKRVFLGWFETEDEAVKALEEAGGYGA